jgi:hypothetical protein
MDTERQSQTESGQYLRACLDLSRNVDPRNQSLARGLFWKAFVLGGLFTGVCLLPSVVLEADADPGLLSFFAAIPTIIPMIVVVLAYHFWWLGLIVFPALQTRSPSLALEVRKPSAEKHPPRSCNQDVRARARGAARLPSRSGAKLPRRNSTNGDQRA